MMLQIFIWLLIFAFFIALVLLLNYWIYLFETRENYSREEIVNVPKILKTELGRLLAGQDMSLRVVSFVGGLFTAWALTFLGGFLAPDLSPAPDYAADQVPNYFFQSGLFLFILHLIWPAFKDISASSQKQFWLQGLARLDLPFFISLSVGLAAMNLSLWGLYHEMHFLYCVMNLLLCLGYASYRLRAEEQKLVKAEEEKNITAKTESEGLKL